MKKISAKKIISLRNSIILIFTSILIFSGVLFAQYKRGSYNKTLLFNVEYDKDVLPRGGAYTILRSVDKETHIVVYDMNVFIFYIDLDNTTEDDIDIVYSYDPNDKNSLKRIENPFKAGEFQKFKEGLMRSGMTSTSGSYGYPGVDEFLAHAQKYKYAAVRRDNGFAVQFKDPDTNQMKSMLGVDSTKNNLVLQNNYDYSAGKWAESEIIYPVYAKNSMDPTVKKVVADATNRLGELLKGRK